MRREGWPRSEPGGEPIGGLQDAAPAVPGECDKCGAPLPSEPIKVIMTTTGFAAVTCSRDCADYSKMDGHDDFGNPNGRYDEDLAHRLRLIAEGRA